MLCLHIASTAAKGCFLFLTATPLPYSLTKKNAMTMTPFRILFITMVVTVLAACTHGNKSAGADRHIDSLPILITQIKQCNRLYTTQIELHKIITRKDNRTIGGKLLGQQFRVDVPLSDRAVAIPMDATLKAYIDFSTFSAGNIKRNGRKIEVILPDPAIEITSTKIDNAGVHRSVGLLRNDYTDSELTVLEAEGRKSIVKDIPQLGIISRARQNAAATIIPIIVAAGYDENDVTVTFRKDFSRDDIPALINGSGDSRTSSERQP